MRPMDFKRKLWLLLPVLWAAWSLTSLSYFSGQLQRDEEVPNNGQSQRVALSKQEFTLKSNQYHPSIEGRQDSRRDPAVGVGVSAAGKSTTTSSVVLADGNEPAGDPDQRIDQRKNGNITAGFIHIGKTGGSTISRVLRNGCHSIRPPPCKPEGVPNETVASKLVQDYYHIVLDTARISSSNHDIYIISTREVYDRFVSAFVYLHPRNKQIFKRPQSREDMIDKLRAYFCFKSLEAFTSHIGDNPLDFSYKNPDLINNRNCTNLSRAIVAGQLKALEHMYNNYQNILDWIPSSPARDIYLIRQDHLWDDWIRINHMLGQTEAVVLPEIKVRRNMTELAEGKSPIVTKDVSELGRNRLCHALEEEYKAYFELFQQAKNLGSKDIEEAVSAGRERCPHLDFETIRKGRGRTRF